MDEANVARGSEPRNGRPLGLMDVSAEQFRNNHITLTPPHLAPPVPKARPADTTVGQ